MKTTFLLLWTVLWLSVNLVNAQWTKTNGPEGITVTSFFDEDSILLCGTYAQGVYRSYDHGNTWTVSNTGTENKWIDCFVKDGSYIYAGSFGEGVFRSSDNGHTWQPANAGIQTQAVYSLVIAGNFLIAGTVGGGVFRSPDQGNTWEDANGGALGSSFIHAMVYAAPKLMVEADNYIFYTFNYGDTWFVDQGNTAFYVINDFYQKGDTVLAAALGNLFRTTDGGDNWTGPVALSESVVGFDNLRDTIYAGTASGVFYSPNWGVSWTQVPATGLRTGASDFIISGNNLLLGREEIGIAKSSDKGSNWTQLPLSQFARASTIDNAIIFANGTVYSGTHGNGVFASTDQGDNWTKIGTTNQFSTLSNEIVFAMHHIDPDILLAGGCPDGLFRSTNNGTSWTHITAGLPNEDNYTCFKSFAQCGSNVLAALTDGVYYSTDNGLTWNATNLTGPSVLYSSGFAVRGNIACVGMVPFPGNNGVYRSTDFGVTWSFAAPIPDIESMAAGGNNTMYAGNLFSSYVSHDDGISWTEVPVGGGFAILAYDQYGFVGNNEGLFYTEDFGDNWEQAIEGFDPYPNNAVQGLAKDSQYIYAGFFRNAVWRRPLSDFGTTGCVAPTVSVNANGPVTFCEGGTVMLTASATGTPVTYQWKKNNKNITGQTGSSYVAGKSGSYTVVVTNDCGVTTSAAILVTVNKNPDATITPSGTVTMCPGGQTLLSANTGSQLSYQWIRNGATIAGATSSTYTATSGGKYTVKVTKNTTGCFKISAITKIKVISCVNEPEGEFFAIQPIDAYPNPSANSFTLDFKGGENYDVKVYDMLGRPVKAFYRVSSTLEFGDDLIPGTYSVQVSRGDRFLQAFKLIKL